MTISNPCIRHTLFALGLAAAVLPLNAQAVKSGDTFDDWQIQCETPEGLTQEVCHAYQFVSRKGGEDQGGDKRILNVAVGYTPTDNHPIAIFTVPLGVALQAGIQVKVDEGEARRIPFNLCTKLGCQAGAKLDKPEILEEFRKGKTLTVTFGNLKRQGLNVPVSLKGFSKALDALKK